MWNNWKIGQNVRVTFTDKELEPGQSIDCQIAGILRKSCQDTLLFNVPRLSLFYANEKGNVDLLWWEYLLSTSSVLALVSEDRDDVPETLTWKATVEPLSDREDTGEF